jgi:type VI secretion system protein ImpJ
MQQTQKIVWVEGMFLRPHHFQQCESHLESQIVAWGKSQNSNYWGFVEKEVDPEALRRGSIVLTAASGIFPDGTFFSFRGANNAPTPLTIESGTTSVKVVLAIPACFPGREQITFQESADSLARYRAVDTEVADLNAMAIGPAEIQSGQLRMKLMLENELTADWTALGVVSVIERRRDNSLQLDESYIPPLLNCHADARLEGFIADTLGLLQQRGQMLAQRLAEAGRSGVSEVVEFLMLQLVNRYYGLTHHAHQEAQFHPERLFSEWLKLVAELATFSPARTIGDNIPLYNHDNLSASFEPLMLQLRQQLSMIIEENAVQINLTQKSHGLYVASIADPHMLDGFGFVLAVSAKVPVDVIRNQFPARMKIAPVNRIKDLVQLQLPGIGLKGMPVAPREIPYHAGYTYFELEKTGDLWSQMERARVFALHVAGEFPDLQMEFWAIRAA